jgi:hypothetical protein
MQHSGNCFSTTAARPIYSQLKKTYVEKHEHQVVDADSEQDEPSD